MGNGWICLHRSIIDNWVFSDPVALKAWLCILLSANHKETKVLFDGELIPVQKGQFLTSVRKFADKVGCTRRKAEKLLELFEMDSMIHRTRHKKGTLLTIENYSLYQDMRDSESTNESTSQSTGESTTQSTTQSTQTTMINNDNNENNKRERSKFAPPTLQDVIDYCIERKNNVSPQKFISYYESNGWMVGRNHMKDWKAAVRTWEQRDKEDTTQQPQKQKNQSLEFAQRTYTDDDIKALERKKLGLA